MVDYFDLTNFLNRFRVLQVTGGSGEWFNKNEPFYVFLRIFLKRVVYKIKSKQYNYINQMFTMKKENYNNIQETLSECRNLMTQFCTSDLSPDSVLYSALHYHLSTPGSESRALLCISACLALGISIQDSARLAAAVESLHNASLILDDLQDSDELRRGKTAVWRKFGKNVAINASDVLLSSAFALAASAGDDSAQRLVPIMSRSIIKMLQGQTRDLEFCSQSTIDDVISIAIEKSGSLFSLCLELPIAYKGHFECLKNASEAGASFGIGYQIFDDLDDQDKDSATKNRCNLVSLVTKSGSKYNPANSAEELAVYFLRQASIKAGLLPQGCGGLLIKKCSNLIKKISREAA